MKEFFPLKIEMPPQNMIKGRKTFFLQGQHRGHDDERYDQDRQHGNRYGNRGYQEDRYGEDSYGQDRHDGHEDDDDGEYEVPVSEDNLQVKVNQLQMPDIRRKQ